MKDQILPHALIARPTILILDAPDALNAPGPGAPEREVLAARGIDAELIDLGASGAALDPDHLARADFILTWRRAVDAAMLEQARRCLLVVHYGPGAGLGVARVALEAARRLGIYVTSVPDFAPDAWADQTFDLLEQLRREIPGAAARPLDRLRLGLVGLGSVGRRVARRARALGMQVWACDPFVSQDSFDQEGVQRADLATLVGISDVLSLHLPLGPATRGMLGEENLPLCKAGAVLINSSAAELVALGALAEGLRRGRPAAAAFDRDPAEILPAGHPLLGHEKIIHSSSPAGASPDAALACRRRVAELIALVLRGNRSPHLLIDPPCPRHILLMANQDWS